MSRYGMISALFLSFYSKSLYQDVGKNWGGKAFLYLLFVLALSWIWPTYHSQQLANQYFSKNADAFIAQVPVIEVKEGKVNTPENKPYLITDPDTKANLVIIDTSGQYTTLENVDAGILITKNQIISKPKPDQIRIDMIPETANVVIQPEKIGGMLASYLGYLWVPLFFVVVLLSFFGRIIQALLYAILGKIFSGITGSRVSYGTIVQIVFVAITPALIISSVLDVLSIQFAYQHLFNFVLTTIYIFYGIVANRA